MYMIHDSDFKQAHTLLPVSFIKLVEDIITSAERGEGSLSSLQWSHVFQNPCKGKGKMNS